MTSYDIEFQLPSGIWLRVNDNIASDSAEATTTAQKRLKDILGIDVEDFNYTVDIPYEENV